MLRHAFTFAAVVCAGLAFVLFAVAVRGRFRTDYVKTFTWDPVTRHYREWYVSNQGGLILVHSEGSTLAAAADTGTAAARAGPTGYYRKWRVTQASGHSYGPWIWYDSDHNAHAGVVNFGGMAQTYTFECRPAVVGTMLLLLPAGGFAARWFAARRRRVAIGAGCCAACGYDLRASPERCPECGAASPDACAPAVV